MGEQGGYCDCEVLANLAGLDESLQATPMVPRIDARQKQKRAPWSLDTVTGWDLTKLPAPWRVANLYDPSEPVRLGLGKKDDCSIAIIEAALPVGDLGSEEYWRRLWFARTGLPEREVVHGALALPEAWKATLVRSPRWTPVYCWVRPSLGAWHLEIKTELDQCAGDLPQLAALIGRGW